MNNSPARPAFGGACISAVIGTVCILERRQAYGDIPFGPSFTDLPLHQAAVNTASSRRRSFLAASATLGRPSLRQELRQGMSCKLPLDEAHMPQGTPSRHAGTVSRSVETPSRANGTPSRHAGTASRSAGTPSRYAGTASRGTGTAFPPTETASRAAGTPSRSVGTRSRLTGTRSRRMGTGSGLAVAYFRSTGTPCAHRLHTYWPLKNLLPPLKRPR